MILTIDGPAGTGKSTIAKAVAESLNYVYFDTGAMYRSFTWFSMREEVDAEDSEGLENLLSRFHFDIRLVNDVKSYFVNDQDVTTNIRSREVTALVSQVASIRSIREGMVAVQRQYAVGVNAVFEGRDLGTVVFPNAELKVYLTATAEIRADRRYKELLEKSDGEPLDVTYEEILADINLRDERDQNREVSPLRQAEDAYLIDTSDLTISEVVDAVLAEQKARSA